MGSRRTLRILIFAVFLLAHSSAIAAESAFINASGIGNAAGAGDAPGIGNAAAFEASTGKAGEKTGWSTDKKVFVLRVTVAGAVVGNSILNWIRLGKPDFKTSDDGWFELSAPNAGADKTGHAFSTYLISRTFSGIYRKFGMDERSADWQGPLSAWATMFLAEIHDVFQGYGFSYKDIVANSTGATLAFFEERYDTFNDIIDYRIEYLPSEGFLNSGDSDFLTDYGGMKHLLVFKPSGVKALASGPLSYLELHAGYYTKGTAYGAFEGDPEKSRHLYAGVSLNFTGFLKKAEKRSTNHKKSLHAASVFLEFYQLPYVSLNGVYDVDD